MARKQKAAPDFNYLKFIVKNLSQPFATLREIVLVTDPSFSKTTAAASDAAAVVSDKLSRQFTRLEISVIDL